MNRKQEIIYFLLKKFTNDEKPILDKDILNEFENLTPIDLLVPFSVASKENINSYKLINAAHKIINISHRQLKLSKYKDFEDGIIYFLMKENRIIEEKVEKLKFIVKNNLHYHNDFIVLINELLSLNNRYKVIQNTIMPTLQKTNSEFDGLKIMWSLQDKIIVGLKQLKEKINNKAAIDELNVIIGTLTFEILGQIKKEEYILFPLFDSFISNEINVNLFKESQNFEWAFLSFQNSKSSSSSGEINFAELKNILEHLPLDITYVDKYDKVRYFTNKDRIFPRSESVIGLDVRNCHPKESLNTVEQIIESMKNGTKTHAKFWINVKDKKIMIEYYRVEDENGQYAGIIEVTQNITDIIAIKGEKRLLDWN
jgi:DUF438 domain-containing protein